MTQQDSPSPSIVFSNQRQWILLVLVGIFVALGFLLISRITQPSRPNILLITIDTLRSDRLGCYGRSPTPSPTMDWIAEQGYLFERCYASSSWTLPSVMSIHTGQYPFTHGVEWVDKTLPKNILTLAERLKAEEYNTAAVESSLFLQRQFGFGRGFDHYEEKPIHNHREISSPSLTDRSLRMLSLLTLQREKPFFYWVHYLDPHYDYLNHPGGEAFVQGVPKEELEKEYSILDLKKNLYSLTPEQYEYQSKLYDGEIFFTDREIRRLVQFLERLGIWDRTCVIITSDHGEMLGEHGALGHTDWYYEPVLRVPLIIKPAHSLKQSKRISSIAGIVDIIPTLLRELKIKYDPESFDGIDLLNPRPQSSQEIRWAKTKTEKIDFIARLGDLKWIYEPQTNQQWVYDPTADPGENQNLSNYDPEDQAEFQKKVRQIIQEQQRKAMGVDVDQDLLDQMKRQGYLDGGISLKPDATPN